MHAALLSLRGSDSASGTATASSPAQGQEQTNDLFVCDILVADINSAVAIKGLLHFTRGLVAVMFQTESRSHSASASSPWKVLNTAHFACCSPCSPLLLQALQQLT